MIDEALAAASRVELPQDALAGLLAAWRELPAPALADAIDMIGARIAGKSLSGTTATAKRTWRTTAKRCNAEDLDRLLRSWRDVPGAEVAVRAELLRAWPADPRRDAAVVLALHDAPYRTTPRFWTQLCALAGEIRDVRQLDRLRTIVALYPTLFARGAATLVGRVLAILNRVIEALAAVEVPELGSTGRAALAVLVPPPVITRSRAAELRDRIFEQPEDYALRGIYADALIEAGDPLGELIALTLHARGQPATAAQQSRITTLTKQLTPAMLGPLHKIVYRSELEFECGFLSRCTINPASPQLVDEAIGDPWWSTVVALHAPATVFLHPVLGSLRRLRTMYATDLAALVGAPTPPALVALRCEIQVATLQVARRLALPELRVLEVDRCNTAPRALLDLPVIAQLDCLRVDLPWTWRPWIRALCDLPCPVPLVLVIREDYEAVELHVTDRAIDVRFPPRPRRVEQQRQIAAIVAILDGLDRRVSAVTVTPSRRITDPALRTQIETALERVRTR